MIIINSRRRGQGEDLRGRMHRLVNDGQEEKMMIF
jgi:hypothetical protein